MKLNCLDISTGLVLASNSPTVCGVSIIGLALLNNGIATTAAIKKIMETIALNKNITEAVDVLEKFFVVLQTEDPFQNYGLLAQQVDTKAFLKARLAANMKLFEHVVDSGRVNFPSHIG